MVPSLIKKEQVITVYVPLEFFLLQNGQSADIKKANRR
jgi:hypothetical protein